MDTLQPISSIMTRNPICLAPSDSVLAVHNVFRENRIHHIPIVHNNELVGIVSKSDYLFFQKGFTESEVDKQIENLRLSAFTVNDIMTKGIAKLQSSDRISVAIEIFKENLFHAIPVVDGEKLVGILTTFDLISQLSVVNNEQEELKTA